MANFEHLGYEFEPTAGLYSGWEPNGIHQRIFSELKVGPPKVDRLSPAYVVRLPDGLEISVSEDSDQFESDLSSVFPECSEAAIAFYHLLEEINSFALGKSSMYSYRLLLRMRATSAHSTSQRKR